MQTQYDPELGVVVILLIIALLAAVIFGPGHLGLISKFVLVGLVYKGMHWGIAQIRGAVKARSLSANETHNE